MIFLSYTYIYIAGVQTEMGDNKRKYFHDRFRKPIRTSVTLGVILSLLGLCIVVDDDSRRVN